MNRPKANPLLWLASWLLALLSPLDAAAQAPAQEAKAPQAAQAGEPAPLGARELATVEASIDRALNYLALKQAEDGSWPSGVGQGGSSNHGVNAIAVLAFLGRGHSPSRGPHRAVLDRGVRNLLSSQNEVGVFLSPAKSHGVMYEHALATLATVEAYGVMPSLDMRKSVQRAVNVIVHAQNRDGGWRYNPQPLDADLSVTVMQVVALRAAVNARLEVPQRTFDRALAYARSCAHPQGGFCYQPGQAPSQAQTAAGLLCMQLLGAFEDPAVEAGFHHLHLKPFVPDQERYHHYMLYYAQQAHYQRGGAWWDRWHEPVRRRMLAAQRDDGSWPGYQEERINGPTAAYSTAMAAMTLEVYLHYLPAYQR